MQRGVHSALSCKKALEQNVEQVGLNRKSRTAELYLLRLVIFTSTTLVKLRWINFSIQIYSNPHLQEKDPGTHSLFYH